MDGLASKPVKLSDLSPEEIAYREQLKYLNRHIPKEDEYLLDGLLYYRVRILGNSCLVCCYSHIYFAYLDAWANPRC